MEEQIIEQAVESRTEDKIENKEVSFSVKMNVGIMYDYLIRHAYSGVAGIVGTCFGALGILFFLKTSFFLYLILGVMLIFYLPFTLWTQASKAVTTNPAYQLPLDYKLNAEGITVSQGEATETAPWETCIKAVSSKQSIIVYTGKRNAFVFPRKQMQDKLAPAIAVIAENMEPQKVKIRF